MYIYIYIHIYIRIYVYTYICTYTCITVDNSGFKIFYTDTLRANDAGKSKKIPKEPNIEF